jgi:hypothetical protein
LEAWTLSKSGENTLGIWERKIFGPVQENCVWRIRTDQLFINLYRKPDIISEIRKRRLRWLGHVERMSEERNALTNTPEGERFVGKPRKRWLDNVENDREKTGVPGWKKTAKDRDTWSLESSMDRRARGQSFGAKKVTTLYRMFLHTNCCLTDTTQTTVQVYLPHLLMLPLVMKQESSPTHYTK